MKFPGEVIYQFGIRCHQYLSNTQLYISTHPREGLDVWKLLEGKILVMQWILSVELLAMNSWLSICISELLPLSQPM